ncbi:MAG TPA: hypothetical protein VGB85_12980 [Nannocystis sp.]
MNFASLFREITGQYPYPYQALLATSGDLPDLFSIPTGAGKTAAIVLGWLWGRRFADVETRGVDEDRVVVRGQLLALVDGVAEQGVDSHRRFKARPAVAEALPGLLNAAARTGVFADPPLRRAVFQAPKRGKSRDADGVTASDDEPAPTGKKPASRKKAGQ